ncbi:hypothetical protein J6590_087596 [Homalodisca vitripennis]|nr:hypothetical protein J6590_087596 [Homalodisca vitripennis]
MNLASPGNFLFLQLLLRFMFVKAAYNVAFTLSFYTRPSHSSCYSPLILTSHTRPSHSRFKTNPSQSPFILILVLHTCPLQSTFPPFLQSHLTNRHSSFTLVLQTRPLIHPSHLSLTLSPYTHPLHSPIPLVHWGPSN